MDDNNKEEKVLTGREEKEKISKERDKVAVIEHTIFAYCSNREEKVVVEKEEAAEKGEEKDNKKKSKRGWPTRGL